MSRAQSSWPSSATDRHRPSPTAVAATANAPEGATSETASRPRKPWGRRTLVIAGCLAVTAGGAVLLAPRLLPGAGDDDPRVASIEREATYQDPVLLAKAFSLPAAAAYLAGGLDYQRNGSFCGPTTTVDVLRSLGEPADQRNVLKGTDVRTTLGFVWGGLTLDQEAELVRKRTGRQVTVLRGLDLSHFRAEVARANDPGRRLAVNFLRRSLFGRGGGHHSPIGGYLADDDLVLVLDVNPSYKPWLVKTERLYRAVDTIDRKTNRKRGLLRVE